MPDDLSSTMRFRRDSLVDFCRYWLRFQLIGKLELLRYLTARRRQRLVRRLLAAEVAPIGLAARDTLRLEAGFPLYGQEFTDDTNPLCSGYRWVVKDKPFFGREALWEPDCRRRLVGLKLRQRGIARHGYRILDGDREVGEITSGTISPLTRESIALGWIDRDHAEEGTLVGVEIRGQSLPATITSPPFF